MGRGGGGTRVTEDSFVVFGEDLWLKTPHAALWQTAGRPLATPPALPPEQEACHLHFRYTDRNGSSGELPLPPPDESLQDRSLAALGTDQLCPEGPTSCRRILLSCTKGHWSER